MRTRKLEAKWLMIALLVLLVIFKSISQEIKYPRGQVTGDSIEVVFGLNQAKKITTDVKLKEFYFNRYQYCMTVVDTLNQSVISLQADRDKLLKNAVDLNSIIRIKNNDIDSQKKRIYSLEKEYESISNANNKITLQLFEEKRVSAKWKYRFWGLGAVVVTGFVAALL